jgi:ribosomal subunit interface protein
MKTPLQIAFHNLDVSESLRRLVEEKAEWLERFHDRITACRVVVEAPHRRRRQGKAFHVRIDLDLPGATLVVRRGPADLRTEDPAAVIRDAFDSARRQVEDFARRRRAVKHHPDPEEWIPNE